MFLFRLAAHLGGMTVAELQDRMGAGELAEWRAYARIDPFGGEVDDYRAAIGPAMTANMNRGKDADIVKPFDVLPWRSKVAAAETKAPLTKEETAAKLKAMFDGISKGAK